MTGNHRLVSKQNLHGLGVSYLCNFLDRAGFSILEWNTAPEHHFQILARESDRYYLIAVRTACHPDEGTIDPAGLETLVGESERLGAVPHFAALSVIPLATDDIEVDSSPGGRGYRVIFNGIRKVSDSALRAVNE